MSQRRKNIWSTKLKTKEQDVDLNSINNIVKKVATKVVKTNEAHVFIKYSSKLYSDQTGKSHAQPEVETNAWWQST